MTWDQKTVQKVSIFSKYGGKTKLISGGKQKEITLKAGQKLTINW
jgi:hypothetical protein